MLGFDANPVGDLVVTQAKGTSRGSWTSVQDCTASRDPGRLLFRTTP